MDLMSIVGLIVGVIGGALGAFSIVVTWKLYQAGDQVNRQTLVLLADIKGSSHTAETTTTRFTERLVGALIELLNRDLKSSLAVGQTTLAERIDSLFSRGAVHSRATDSRESQGTDSGRTSESFPGHRVSDSVPGALAEIGTGGVEHRWIAGCRAWVA